MIVERIDARVLHADNRFFLDYLGGEAAARGLFEHAPDAVDAAAASRRAADIPRADLVDLLRPYNERLDASDAALAHIDALAHPDALCVIGGQQAGFLGGPLFVAHKIRSILAVAARLAARLGAPVVPIFWLATEDHDFTEINRIRTLDAAGDLRTISFAWDGRGRPIERLPITSEIRVAADEALALLPEARGHLRDLFTPDASDDYGRWHARIWSRLFADEGLVLVEPRTVRPLAGPLFARVLSSTDAIAAALGESANALRAAGYDIPLDPDATGGLFAFSEDGRRIRVEDPTDHVDRAAAGPGGYSPDAALRPILADALFPTIASVLGPSELGYHAMLRPLYRLFETPQPLILPRDEATLLSFRHASLLDRVGATVSDILAGTFDAATAARSAASPELLAAFADRKAALRTSLGPLRTLLEPIDPGLDARWRQTADRIGEQVDRLEERAIAADLARSGVSVRELRRLRAEVYPSGRPQERVLSLLHAAARHGLSWVHDLETPATPGETAHYVLSVGGNDG